MSGRGRGRGGRPDVGRHHDGPGFPPRDFDGDRRHDDRDRDRGGDGVGRPGRWGEPVPPRDPHERRRGEGLGYDERDGRGRRAEPPGRWERDRGAPGGSVGRGRGVSADVSFVRGDVEHADAVPPGMGRGRGRGRGRGVDNRPAWMASGGASDGPTGVGGGEGPAASSNDPSLDDLLAKARQAKTGRQEQHRHQGGERGGSSSRPPSSAAAPSRRDRAERDSSRPPSRRQPEDAAARKRREEEAERRAEEERKEAQRRAEEEERARLERQREEDERRQLLALVRDDDSGSNKRGAEDGDDGDDGGLFEFETDEEREARMARKRREERKKRLRLASESAGQEEKKDDGGDATAVKTEVDEPRNAAGVIKSEAEDREALRERAANSVSKRQNQPEKTDGGAPPAKKEDGADSFDMFAEDGGDTPAPLDGPAAGARAGSAAAASAQECDDADGYYKATSGEVIGLRREGGGGGGLGGSAAGRSETSDFRVLGLIGKGVFSSVVKCVEEPEDDAGGGATPAQGGRVVAMKIIRNNEIMAKAALKEMRILRMLCQYKPSSSQKRKKARRQQSQEGGDGGTNANEDEDDEEE